MWIQRILSVPHKFTPIRHLYQSTKVEKAKTLLLDAKTLYVETLPFFIAGTTWVSIFSFLPDHHHKCTFLEHVIYSLTTGIVIGITYPISFPVIAFNTWRKRNYPTTGSM